MAEEEDWEDEFKEQRGRVRTDERVVGTIRMYWNLMVAESVKYGSNGEDVNREGYRNFHLRVSKSLASNFDMDTAEAVANKDWAEDITAFSGDSKDLIWLEEVKKKFKDVTANIVGTMGWKALFERYDKDGSGEIDFGEFCEAARSDMNIPDTLISDADLQALFAEADDDGSGEMSGEEFSAWILAPLGIGATGLAATKAKFREATTQLVTAIGWQALFATYDTDGSGTLDKDEFIAAVRKDCDISERVVEDAALSKMFDAVDDDASGEIDCAEFEQLLASDALAQDMTFEVFFAAMFQLVDLWTTDPPEP